MALSKEQILSADDKKTVVVKVPEWGGEVIVSTMSSQARDAFESSVVGKNGGTNLQNIRAKLAAASLVDEEGELLFDEKDVLKLGRKSAAALQRIFEVSQELNLISQDDVDSLAKN
jgi:hypothetical protein